MLRVHVDSLTAQLSIFKFWFKTMAFIEKTYYPLWNRVETPQRNSNRRSKRSRKRGKHDNSFWQLTRNWISRQLESRPRHLNLPFLQPLIFDVAEVEDRHSNARGTDVDHAGYSTRLHPVRFMLHFVNGCPGVGWRNAPKESENWPWIQVCTQTSISLILDLLRFLTTTWCQLEPGMRRYRLRIYDAFPPTRPTRTVSLLARASSDWSQPESGRFCAISSNSPPIVIN